MLFSQASVIDWQNYST